MRIRIRVRQSYSYMRRLSNNNRLESLYLLIDKSHDWVGGAESRLVIRVYWRSEMFRASLGSGRPSDCCFVLVHLAAWRGCSSHAKFPL